jgi:hypothetical protein
MHFPSFTLGTAALVLSGLLAATTVQAQEIRVTITNLATADGGNLLTPFWVGLHNGEFDVYDTDTAASPSLERLAEDGNTGPLSEDFLNSAAAAQGATLASPDGPLAPGAQATMTFVLAGGAAANGYLSYASMFIPSNDAFVGNDDPLAHPLFDADGNFVGADIVITGAQVRDAGTEVNGEVPGNTAALEQAAPDTGESEGGTIQPHAGFTEGGNILAAIPNGDFTVAGFQVARIVVELASDTPTAVAAQAWGQVKSRF